MSVLIRTVGRLIIQRCPSVPWRSPHKLCVFRDTDRGVGGSACAYAEGGERRVVWGGEIGV